LCTPPGFSGKAYYKFQHGKEKEVFPEDFIVEKVLEIKKLLSRIGGHRIYFISSNYLKKHAIELGRDAFFSLLSRHELLMRI